MYPRSFLFVLALLCHDASAFSKEKAEDEKPQKSPSACDEQYFDYVDPANSIVVDSCKEAGCRGFWVGTGMVQADDAKWADGINMIHYAPGLSDEEKKARQKAMSGTNMPGTYNDEGACVNPGGDPTDTADPPEGRCGFYHKYTFDKGCILGFNAGELHMGLLADGAAFRGIFEGCDWKKEDYCVVAGKRKPCGECPNTKPADPYPKDTFQKSSV